MNVDDCLGIELTSEGPHYGGAGLVSVVDGVVGGLKSAPSSQMSRNPAGPRNGSERVHTNPSYKHACILRVVRSKGSLKVRSSVLAPDVPAVAHPFKSATNMTSTLANGRNLKSLMAKLSGL